MFSRPATAVTIATAAKAGVVVRASVVIANIGGTATTAGPGIKVNV